MSRPIRIQYPGAFYHVMAHACGRQWLYQTNGHLSEFIHCLTEIKEKYHVLIHAAVLMRNHYHLVIETPEGDISRTMRFNTIFSR
jgi:putative transposase